MLTSWSNFAVFLTDIRASSAPSISTATHSANGHVPGDVIISMPQVLANRVQKLIVHELTCFNLKKWAIDLSCVSDAAEALIINAQPGAALNDLLLLRGRGPQFGAVDVARALATAIQFARSFWRPDSRRFRSRGLLYSIWGSLRSYGTIYWECHLSF